MIYRQTYTHTDGQTDTERYGAKIIYHARRFAGGKKRTFRQISTTFLRTKIVQNLSTNSRPTVVQFIS